MARYREISGAAFIGHLQDLGILHEDSRTRRVIIDATFDQPIFIYVEELGTERLLEMKPPDVTGMEVVMVAQEEKALELPRRQDGSVDYAAMGACTIPDAETVKRAREEWEEKGGYE